MSASQSQPIQDKATVIQSAPPSETTKNVHALRPANGIANPIRIAHHPKAGLNPVSDAASQLFSIMGKFKEPNFHRSLSKLQKQLPREMTIFQDTLHHHGYSKEYTIVCRYILCSAFDDIISAQEWGKEWNLFLLTHFKQDLEHGDKFFLIMDRAIKEPDIYIELMELMYLCLTLGYKGRYRGAERELQLEQVINHLYKHIRTFRGSFSKKLSPAPLKPTHKIPTSPSVIKVFFIAGCVMMSIFIVFGILMDVVSHDAYNRIKQIEIPIAQQLSQ